MWVTLNKLTGSVSSMPAPNLVQYSAPIMAAIAGLSSPACARSLQPRPGVFPLRPHTHHVRWIEADVNDADRVFVAIEAGALVRTNDGGRTWRDRVRGGPYDTHTAATHPLAPGRIYSAAGDGYYESSDAGDSWRSPEDGLKHRYLVGLAVDPADPDTVIVSGAVGPRSAYWPRQAETYIYRKTGLSDGSSAMSGLPEAKGTTIASSPLMQANQASSTPPTTAASSDQMMQGRAGRLWNFLGQSLGLPMAWRR